MNGQLDPDTQLSRDVQTTITAVIQTLDIQSTDSPMDAEALLSMVLPRLYSKIDNEPERAKKTLAQLHLETGALLEQHDERTPEAILNGGE